MIFPWEGVTLVGTTDVDHARTPVSYTHLRAHETVPDLVCPLLLDKKKTALTSKATN